MSCASYVEPDRRRTRALQAPHRAVVRLPCWPTITLLYLSWGGPDRGLAPNATSRCSRYYHRRPPNSEDHAPRLGVQKAGSRRSSRRGCSTRAPRAAWAAAARCAPRWMAGSGLAAAPRWALGTCPVAPVIDPDLFAPITDRSGAGGTSSRVDGGCPARGRGRRARPTRAEPPCSNARGFVFKIAEVVRRW